MPKLVILFTSKATKCSPFQAMKCPRLSCLQVFTPRTPMTMKILKNLFRSSVSPTHLLRCNTSPPQLWALASDAASLACSTWMYSDSGSTKSTTCVL